MADGVAITILAKPLADAKQRLSPVLSANERAALAAAMLRDVIAAVAAVDGVTATVRSSDSAIGRMAHAAGIGWQHEARATGLNDAAAGALAEARQGGFAQMLLLPGDLPLVRTADLARLLALGPVAGVRARDGGTNALLLDPALPFAFSFGRDSFAAHQQAATACGTPLQAMVAGGLIDDIDTPEGLARLIAACPRGATGAFLGLCGGSRGRAA